MMQLEREAEGDQFKDKESFVTQAYRDQTEQVRKAEEEEKKREGVFFDSVRIILSQLLTRVEKKAGPCFYRNDALLPSTARRIGAEA
jgi:hypothetical protein